MTLPDDIFPENDACKRQTEAAGTAVMNLLQEAVDSERIVHGIYLCVEFLQRSPDDVMLCILQDSGQESHDVTIDIEHTLIQAYCLENGVRVLKVTNSMALQSLMMSLQGREHKRGDSTVENACLLIKYPDVLDKMDDLDIVVNFYKNFIQYNSTQMFPLPLPD